MANGRRSVVAEQFVGFEGKMAPLSKLLAKNGILCLSAVFERFEQENNMNKP
jgi:hypothetical protein